VRALIPALLALAAVHTAVASGPLPSPPPFAEVLTGEGTRNTPATGSRFAGRERVPSSVATSGHGGGSGRRPSSSATPRFFFAGNGHLTLHHAHFNTTLNVRYRLADGSYDGAALAQIRHFFRSREDGRERDISLRLVELLAYIEEHFHPRQMTLLSGYRSPDFNNDLRAAGGAVALASLHTEAMAADIHFAGIDMARLWRQLRQLGTGGAGYYRSGHFLHIDTGKPRFWEETTSRVGENLAAGNARIFLRTDFDRYARLDGAVLSLHSLTALPLLIAPQAHLVGPDGGSGLAIEPVDDAIERRDGCLAITAAAEAYRFRVASAAPPPSAARARVVLHTCEPRVEKTPPDIESNPIEVGG